MRFYLAAASVCPRVQFVVTCSRTSRCRCACFLATRGVQLFVSAVAGAAHLHFAAHLVQRQERQLTAAVGCGVREGAREGGPRCPRTSASPKRSPAASPPPTRMPLATRSLLLWPSRPSGLVVERGGGCRRFAARAVAVSAAAWLDAAAAHPLFELELLARLPSQVARSELSAHGATAPQKLASSWSHHTSGGTSAGLVHSSRFGSEKLSGGCER